RRVCQHDPEVRADAGEGQRMNGLTPPSRLSTKALRFIVVGLANSAIDFAVFAGLAWLGIAALLANLLAWAVAVSFSFAVNSRWTFESSEHLARENSFVRFALSGAAISLGSSSLSLILLSRCIAILPPKLVCIIICSVMNIFAARWTIVEKVL